MKLDYGNQNARVNSGKDPFSFETDPDNKPDAALAVVKPKKFFKSRNVPSVVEESHQDVAIYRQVPDSQYGRARVPKQPPQQQQQQQLAQKQAVTKTSHAPVKKIVERLDSTGATEAHPNREEGKPPIVLRIVKGTARLVCGDVQDTQDTSESETYRISTPLASPSKIDVEHKTFVASETSLKSDHKPIRSHQPIVSTVSIPLENSDMRRTTRSRAKNLHLDLTTTTSVVASTVPITSNSHGSGLSLTLRKSITDSNNTLISHYDIVKTDCGSTNSSKPTIEPLIGRDQPLPTTTQELIDILSSDSDTRPPPPASPLLPPPSSSPSPSPLPAPTPVTVTNIAETEETVKNVTSQVQHCSIDIPTNEVVPEQPTVAAQPIESELETTEPDPESESEPTARTSNTETAAAKALVDQDWFSGSDDSEGASGNVENDIPLHATSAVSESQVSNPPSTSVPTSNKPVAMKKGSIFKSRSTGTTNGNKRRALYKHKWCDSDKESITTDTPTTGNSTPTTASGSHSSAGPAVYEEEFDSSQLTRVVTYPETDADFEDEADAITSVRCGKKVKGVSIVLEQGDLL